MNIEDFKITLKDNDPPKSISSYLKALWYDKKGDWEMAHNIAQEITDENGSWIHAYLHRKEGDSFNAGYWYRKAGKKMPDFSLDKEWEELLQSSL